MVSEALAPPRGARPVVEEAAGRVRERERRRGDRGGGVPASEARATPGPAPARAVGLRIDLASPETIRAWSSGEVLTPDGLNMLTLKPEPGGLLCERIFGPYRDWECGCGRLKGREREGRTCRHCGVRVGRADARRERMGHVELATPVVHPWFLRGHPGQIALLLDCPARALERVVAHDAWLVLDVDTPVRDARLAALCAARDEAAGQQARLLVALRLGLILDDAARAAVEVDPDQQPVARLGTGGAAVREALAALDLGAEAARCRANLAGGAPGRRTAARLRLIETLRRGGVRPEWLVLTALPVLPAGLRPVLALDGGRFVASDLNELYGRAIARNNRLKALIAHRAPEPILRNERRLLQLAVEALIDNARSRRPVARRGGTAPLASLGDLLRGKGGRLRRNLLGKRVDYSGRSVIAVGPGLRLGECGLPARLALELFKPFVMRELLVGGLAGGARDAKRLVERADDAVWAPLARAMRGRVVLLNRAPTLHMGSLQAFDPVLLDPGAGDAIRLHPLACKGFNADFDGDQMAVHLPLSVAAQAEARALLHARTNLLSAASGEPAILPQQDIVLGCYYLTMAVPGAKGEGKAFADADELALAYEHGAVEVGAAVRVRLAGEAGLRATTAGRVLCHEALRAALAGHGAGMDALGFRDEALGARALARLLADCHARLGAAATADLADAIKEVGFRWSTRSGLSIGRADLAVPPEKGAILGAAESEAAMIRREYERGTLSEYERRAALVALWTGARDRVAAAVRANLDPQGALAIMVDSGARGNASQLSQLAGMRGLITDAAGRVIEVPVTANYREGIPVLQYFLMSSGARKGATDRSLRTADAGYLTRRLVDVAQDVFVTEEDCGTADGLAVPLLPTPDVEGDRRARERLRGRHLARPVAGDGARPPLPAGAVLDDSTLALLLAAPRRPAAVVVRSPLRCAAPRGVCRRCYGLDPATGCPVALGAAVGVIAAQSNGEPGTQLTMKTFQLGGVAAANITDGLPRVKELFEAVRPRGAALLAPRDGTVVIAEGGAALLLRPLGAPAGPLGLAADNGVADEYAPLRLAVPAGRAPVVATGARVAAGQALTDGPRDPHALLALAGRSAAEAYLVDEIAGVYRAQGVALDPRHIELIVRLMTGWATVEDGGDTPLLPGALANLSAIAAADAKARAAGGVPATLRPMLLGVTRAALASDSFLAAAGFQETTGVLAAAALAGRVDRLDGLKARALLGRRMPARRA